MDDGDRKALADIEEYGCHVVGVLEEGELPPFTYSMGIQQKTKSPEVVVVGLKQEIAHFMVNEYNRRVVAGEVFQPYKRYSGFLEGFECEVRPVHGSHFKEYFGYCWWLYKGPHFNMVQLVWPNTSGVWPWQSEASEWFQSRQPLLDAPLVEGGAPQPTVQADGPASGGSAA